MQLAWDTEGVTSCTASGGWSGARAVNGNATLIPNQPTNSYALSCVGDNGGAVASVNIDLIAQGPVSVDLQTDVDVTAIGSDAILSWTTRGASSCTASGAWTGARPLRGVEVVRGIGASKTFTLQCSGPAGAATDAVSVTIAPAPSLSIIADPAAVYTGEKTELRWQAQNANNCMASGAWSGPRATSGTELSAALSSDANFSLACTGISGSVSKFVSVTVSPPPNPSLSLKTFTPSVPSGSIGLLQWEAVRMSNCTASGGWSGSREASGTEAVGPLTSNQTYTLQCSGPTGPISKTVNIAVGPAPPAATKVELLSAEFVELTGRAAHEGFVAVNDQPVLRGVPNTMSVALTGPVDSVAFSFIDSQAQKLADVDLPAVTDTSLSGDFRGDVSIPAQRFRLRATGLTQAGAPFELTSREFAAVEFSTRFGRGEVILHQGEQVTLPVTFQNHGASGTFVLTITGPQLNISPETITLGPGEAGERNVVIDSNTYANLPIVFDVTSSMTRSNDSSRPVRGVVSVAVLP